MNIKKGFVNKWNQSCNPSLIKPFKVEGVASNHDILDPSNPSTGRLRLTFSSPPSEKERSFGADFVITTSLGKVTVHQDKYENPSYSYSCTGPGSTVHPVWRLNVELQTPYTSRSFPATRRMRVKGKAKVKIIIAFGGGDPALLVSTLKDTILDSTPCHP